MDSIALDKVMVKVSDCFRHHKKIQDEIVILKVEISKLNNFLPAYVDGEINKFSNLEPKMQWMKLAHLLKNLMIWFSLSEKYSEKPPIIFDRVRGKVCRALNDLRLINDLKCDHPIKTTGMFHECVICGATLQKESESVSEIAVP